MCVMVNRTAQYSAVSTSRTRRTVISLPCRPTRPRNPLVAISAAAEPPFSRTSGRQTKPIIVPKNGQVTADHYATASASAPAGRGTGAAVGGATLAAVSWDGSSAGLIVTLTGAAGRMTGAAPPAWPASAGRFD